jgi:hypothetical protein
MSGRCAKVRGLQKQWLGKRGPLRMDDGFGQNGSHKLTDM